MSFSPTIIPRLVTSDFPQNTGVVKEIQDAFSSGAVFDVNLRGKYSQGAAIALVDDGNRAWLLKPDVAKMSPAAGISDFPTTKPNREAAFYEIANAVGVTEVQPAYSIRLDGHPVTATKLVPTDYQHVSALQKIDPSIVTDIIGDYRKNGTVWKWAFLDYLLGNTDRHSNNILIDPETATLVLIDHGGAFAGANFNPSDPKTFVPYYLRCHSGKHFNRFTPEQRFNSFDRPSSEEEDSFKAWLRHIDAPALWSVLHKYGMAEKPFKDRFEQILLASRPVEYLLKKWAGYTPDIAGSDNQQSLEKQ